MRKKLVVLGFVLKKEKLKEKDIILSLFTYEFGKLLIFAKGALKLTSRRLSHLDTGNLIKAWVIQKDDLFYLSETKLISGFLSIKKNYKKIQKFFLILKAVNKVVLEKQQETEIFSLLLESIKKINEEKFREEEFFKQLSDLANIEIDEIKYHLEVLRVPMDHYGCVIAALVYLL